jgi:hypothetical protein
MSIDEANPDDLDKDYMRMSKDIKTTIIDQSPKDMVNSPSHYTAGSIECIDAIEASMTPEAFKGYCKGACMKYLWRYEHKGKSLEDLKKARWYLNKLMTKVEG